MTESEISILPAVYYTVHLASTTYFNLSMLSPAHETILDHTILDQETLPDNRNISGGDEKKEFDDYRVDETGVA
jgi:hypothetical protein